MLLSKRRIPHYFETGKNHSGTSYFRAHSEKQINYAMILKQVCECVKPWSTVADGSQMFCETLFGIVWMNSPHWMVRTILCFLIHLSDPIDFYLVAVLAHRVMVWEGQSWANFLSHGSWGHLEALWRELGLLFIAPSWTCTRWPYLSPVGKCFPKIRDKGIMMCFHFNTSANSDYRYLILDHAVLQF